MNDDIKDYDYTNAAWESMYDVVDNAAFLEQDALLIYKSLKNRLKSRSFGDYLKRYIFLKAGLVSPFSEIPLSEYQSIIKYSFMDNNTPQSFVPTTAKLSALSKNWLTQQTVKRNVIFLLGFGLNMSVEDVNMFLTKALREHEINPKDPFEVICWYCYKKQYNYLKFEQLWNIYNNMPSDANTSADIYTEGTIGVRNTAFSIQNDNDLMNYVSKLKANTKMSAMSVTSHECFLDLYNESRDLVAKMYNENEADEHEEKVQSYIKKLAENDRLFDYDKQKLIEKFRSEQKVFSRDDISESDIEHIICAAIPTDRHGNLTPGKASELNEQFSGKRFSRQRISEILSGNADVTRFDLITLNFFIFSQQLDIYSDPKIRFVKFCESMNAILEKCFLGKLYVQNPYECFVMMCVLSDDPLGAYSDVWELSYTPDVE